MCKTFLHTHERKGLKKITELKEYYYLIHSCITLGGLLMKDDIKSSIKKLLQKYNAFEDNNTINNLSEELTKSEFVEPLLEIMGFKSEWHSFQNFYANEKSSITVIKDGRAILFVEVIKASKTMNSSVDLKELTNYLGSKGIEWGLVTNGKYYVLVNNHIKGEYIDKEVKKYNLFDENNNINYLTYNYLLEEKYSNYLYYLKQYNIYKMKDNDNYNSWTRYNETLEKYFKYLEHKKIYKDLKEHTKSDFMEFIKHEINESKNNVKRKVISSIETIKNKYSHIKNLYDLFIKNEILTENPFNYIPSDNDLVEMYELSHVEESISLNIEEIGWILDGFDKDVDRNPERNKIMFLLCLYTGAKREYLANMKTSDINYENRTIKFNDEIYIFPQEFINRIQKYIENIQNKEFKSDYFFARKYKESEKPITAGHINNIIQKTSEYYTNKSITKKIQINPEKIKGMLARKLFEANFSLEEIIMITGISLVALSNHITNESILERTKVNQLDERHPYIDLFKRKVD